MNSPSIDVFDKKLKKLLAACAKSKLTPSQRNLASTHLKNLAVDAEVFGLSRVVEEVGDFILTRERLKELSQPVIFPTDHFLEFGRRGLPITLQFGISDSPEAFAGLPVEVLLKELPSPVLLNQIAKKRQKLLAEALVVLQAQPELAVHFAGLPWVVTKAKIEHLFPLLPVIFRVGDRNTDTDDISTLRVQFLARDKAGIGIAEILGRVSKGELSTGALIDGLRRCPEAAVFFLRILPKFLSKSVDNNALKILEGWLPCLAEILPPKRALVSGALAILCGGLLQKPQRTLAEEMVFSLVTSYVRQLSIQIDNDVGG